MERLSKYGVRSVELLNPIQDGAGAELAVVVIQPVKLDHVIRWTGGKLDTFTLLSELTGLAPAILHELTFPDVDRVLAAFMLSVPPAIRGDIESGNRPMLPQPQQPPQTEQERQLDEGYVGPLPEDSLYPVVEDGMPDLSADDGGFDIGDQR